MGNFFNENSDMLFHLENDDLEAIIKYRESNFQEKESFEEAPNSVADAKDDYKRVLEVIGNISSDIIAPTAMENDITGPVFENGEVTLTQGIEDALLALREAGVMGFTLPRKYGGLNFPKTIYTMAIELISQADASLMTLFGLQEISETINKYGSQDQRDRYLPRFCRGEVSGAMALTEPDAGSDLPAIKLKAIQEENEANLWRLTGVKRFITNGCADIILVNARSEEDIQDARGLSLFIYEREKGMKIRRIENKLGIHSSPTCELQFESAPAELLGQRKRGLLTYTMSLMNGARLGVAAQAVGIMQAAYNEARSYAAQRVQYGQTIDKFPQIIELLTTMSVDIEATRTLLYEASRLVDMKEGIEKLISENPELKREKKSELRRYTQFEQLFTPLIKFRASELGNRLCYDAMQIHGGVGYMKEFTIERLYRDIRITSIYEGTSQMQVIAASNAILRNIVFERIKDYVHTYDFSSLGDIYKTVEHCKDQIQQAITYVQNGTDTQCMDFHSVRLVNMTADFICSYLLCIDALRDNRKRKVAQIFVGKASKRISAELEYILTEKETLMELQNDII